MSSPRDEDDPPDGTAWTAPPLRRAVSVHCAAEVIKRFVRELPARPLDSLSDAQLTAAATGGLESAVMVVDRLPLGQASLLVWLVLLLAEVAANSDINGMTPENLGIVVGPNLRSSEPSPAATAAGVSGPTTVADDPASIAAAIASSRALAQARQCGVILQHLIDAVLHSATRVTARAPSGEEQVDLRLAPSSLPSWIAAVRAAERR